ncbi:MAG: UvrD-helicase domain-containing protein [Burkholderiales bacterium]
MNDAAAALARDTAHREQALDTRQSFLVQSPAGSGKTELLIQRFLALLATVERPERIVAMTFTRKAAAEMRERVVAALRAAETDAPARPGDSHRARTRALAAAALARDRALGWNLLLQPAQLAIHTFDAYCSALARQAPLAGRFGGSLAPADDAVPLYREAARALMASAAADDPHWRVLLAHLDNDAEQVVTLLAAMLAKRDQWLPVVLKHDPPALRAHLEQSLQHEIDGELAQLAPLFAPSERAALVRGAAHAAGVLAGQGGPPVLAAALAACARRGDLPAADWQCLAEWQALAHLLLVKGEPQFRKRLDKNLGFPGKAAGAASAAAKAEFEALLERLAELPGLVDALHVARLLPPAAYGPRSWDVITALFAILPRAAAQLDVTFAARGNVDHTSVTLAALFALGDAEAPSDLLLRLDLAVDHLLVDEFQDTSDAQYDLIGRLTAGWTEGDGRTLFAVGDPMQSIYGFRSAEVRLFLEAKAAGRIGNVPVRFVDLARNFRSQGEVVDWVNRVFAAVLPSRNDPWRGAVAFAPAVPVHAHQPPLTPTVDVESGAIAEAERVVARVRAALEAGAADVAILVHKRTALIAILPALRSAGIDYEAVKLDALGERQSVLDLTSLAHAIVQPADRLAALAVLRAPWCGLAIADLIAVAPHVAGGLPGLFAGRTQVVGLSGDGAARLARLAGVLEPAFAERGRAPLPARVRGAWLALGGPATVDEPLDLDTAEAFFAVLAQHCVADDVPDWNALVDALAMLRAAPGESGGARVKVMTVHQAKGLEFDTVILPGLHHGERASDRILLRWRFRRHGLLLAPSAARGGEPDLHFEYLKSLAGTENAHERARLLYVGATRAKTRLHLVARGKADGDPDDPPLHWKPPAARTPLGRLWDSVAAQVADPVALPVANAVAAGAPPLVRLAPGFALPALPPSLPAAATVRETAEAVPFDWARATAAAVGTVTHRLLAEIARDGLAAWSPERVAASAERVRRELTAEGVDAAELAEAADSALLSLQRLLADERGRWLFAPTHSDARSEWALAGVDAGAIVHVTLDRTFVADGVRWIVDFKTGRHEGGDAEAFLAREVERYRPQLERYARIVRGIDARPIRLALYHPRVDGGWRAWDHAAESDAAGSPEIR